MCPELAAVAMQVTEQEAHVVQDNALVDASRTQAGAGLVDVPPLDEPFDDNSPALLTSASPQRQLQPRATKVAAASVASDLTASPLLLSGTGDCTLAVVRTHFAPLGDSPSDSDSDSEVKLSCA